jgi:aminoglycoside phosphotransferase (APT) family kinase protein
MHPGEPVGETLAAIAARHGVPVRAIRRMPTGAANHVYELGADLVLRIPRTSAFVPDLRKEATVIPRVRRLGIRTPAVVSYDDSCSILGLPYVVLERAPGRDLGRSALPPEKAGALLREVGHQLGMLHRGASVLVRELPPETARRAGRDRRVSVRHGCHDRTGDRKPGGHAARSSVRRESRRDPSGNAPKR